MLKKILGGWIGLNNTVSGRTFPIGKEYQYNCDYTICGRPTNADEVLRIIQYKQSASDIQKI